MARTHVSVPFTDSQRPLLLLSEHSQHKVHTYVYTHLLTYVYVYIHTYVRMYVCICLQVVCVHCILHLIADICITTWASRVCIMFFGGAEGAPILFSEIGFYMASCSYIYIYVIIIVH